MVSNRVKQMLWERAEAHEEGAGLSAGVFMEPVRKLYLKMRRADPKRAQALVRVVAGAWWTEERRYRAGLIASPECCICHRGEGTVVHHVFVCMQRNHSTHPDIATTTHLVPKAIAASPHVCAYWCRGLLLHTRLPDLDDQPAWHAVFGTLPSNCTGLELCTDGSGGELGGILRRCGFGWVLVDMAGQIVCGGLGSVPFGPSTVPRAEISAIVHALDTLTVEQIGPDCLPVHTDHLNICKYMAQQPWVDTSRRGNHDMWQRLRQAVERRPCQVHKVPAHATVAKLTTEQFDGVRDSTVVGNFAADAAAAAAAERAQVDNEQARKWQAAVDEHLEVVKRILAVYLEWVGPAADILPDITVSKPASKTKQRYVTAVSSSGHAVAIMRGRCVCMQCLSLANLCRTHVYRWLAMECGGAEATALAPHPTHRIMASRRGELFYCVRCGADATRAKRLRRRCRPCPHQAPAPEEAELELVSDAESSTNPCAGVPAAVVRPPAPGLDDSQASIQTEPPVSQS